MTDLFARLRGAAVALALTALAAAPAFAQAQPAPADPYADLDAEPALWAIRDEDTTLYLFGTFHILPPSLDWRSEAFDAAFEEAELFVFEADVHSPEAQQRMAALIPQLGFNPPGVTLSSLVGEEAAAMVREIAPSVGVSAQGLEALRPWLAQLTLAVSQIQRLGFDPDSGVESVMLEAAREKGASFDYLETVEQQLRFFADMPEALQIAAFKIGLEDIERTPDMLDGMVRAWATGDMDALYAFMTEEMREQTPEVYEAIIVERNAAWIDPIAALMEQPGEIMVAVGAAHMPGEYGVVALLEARGLEAERL